MSEELNNIEETLTAMEESMDTLDAIENGTNDSHLAQLVVVGVLAGLIGGVAAYFVADKRLKTKYEQIAAKEIAEAKEFYSALNKKDDFSTPEKAVGKLIPGQTEEEALDSLRSYQGEDEEESEESDEEAEEVEDEDINVFFEHSVDENFIIEDEMMNRTPGVPYVISEQEFMENENEFSQVTITYYEGDGTLADDRDQEIPFADPIVGEENLQRFGHGSGDDRIVYIRNERLSSDFEVIRSDGKYAHEVLGLEHSDGGSRGRQQRDQLRKYRGEDE